MGPPRGSHRVPHQDHGGGWSLDLGSPISGTSRVNKVLRRASIQCGLSSAIISHDIRRGAAHEYAEVVTKMKGSNYNNARAALGHSASNGASNILTHQYVGAVIRDNLDERTKLAKTGEMMTKRTLRSR